MMQLFPIRTGPVTPATFLSRFLPGEHEGTDIFAPAGAEVLAVEDGKVRHAEETKGGLVVYLTTEDGTQYYYSHLDAIADRMKPGKTRKVRAGDVLGYVGTTGNAKGRAPHVHFEMRPQGGAKVDPAPFLEAVQALPVVAPPPLAKAPPSWSPAAPSPAPSSPSGLGGGVAVLLLLWAFSQRNERRAS